MSASLPHTRTMKRASSSSQKMRVLECYVYPMHKLGTVLERVESPEEDRRKKGLLTWTRGTSAHWEAARSDAGRMAEQH